jgi:sulfate permease, SulP family
MQLVNGLRFDSIRGDIFGGVTAAVVALPLALAFGVASGAGPMAGLYGAIFVGFFAALFGGTPTQISGPTGPMTVVMALVLTKFAHEPALAFTVVMMGGTIQVALGALKLGRFISLVPLTVISGFMSGIGVIIIILQLAPLMGHAIPPGGTIGALIALPEIVLDLKWDAAAVGALALAIAYLTPRRIKRLLPPPLIALVAGTAVVWFVLKDVPILGDIPTGLPNPQLPTLELAAFPDMLGSAVILALLGAIDSLLTSLIADSVTRTNHNSDRELIGQGIGNMVAGLFGGIPGAGATMRTVINVRSGGQTPISGMLHAVILLALVLGLGPLAASIPHAVLAGILISVGIDIIDWRFLRRMRTAPRSGVLIMFLVLGLTVFVDLIMAVAVGIVVASLLFVNRMSGMQLGSIQAADGDLAEVPLTKDEEMLLSRHAKEVMLYKLAGPMSFGAAKGITRRLVCSDTYKVLMLDLSEVTFVDTSAGLALETVVINARDQGKEVFLVGMRVPVRKILHRLGALDHVPANRRFASRRMAFERVAKLVGGASDVDEEV